MAGLIRAAGAVLAGAWTWTFSSVSLIDQAPYRRRRHFRNPQLALGDFAAFLVVEVVDPKPMGNFTRANHSDPIVLTPLCWYLCTHHTPSAKHFARIPTRTTFAAARLWDHQYNLLLQYDLHRQSEKRCQDRASKHFFVPVFG